MHQTRFILQLLCCLAIIPWEVAKAQTPESNDAALTGANGYKQET